MNPGFERLSAYPFERLAVLLKGVEPPAHLPHIPLSIGEPRHAPPAFVIDKLTASMGELGSYPATRGLPELRAAGARWLARRFSLPAGSVDPERHVLPVNGTREALFAFVQAVVDSRRGAATPVVAMPNPGYQVYEGAALLAGAEPYYLNTTADNGFLPDLDAVPAEVWRRCQLLFLCSPANPVGAVMDIAWLRRALELAGKYDFVIASDECYADLYDDESSPPPSLLTAAIAAGNTQFRRCMSFHSLSKRSSLPGLRSGLVAGDDELIRPFLLYRTYHGCAMPIPTQRASIAAWDDDAHVAENRALYRAKFDQVLPILEPVARVTRPAGGFYIWLPVGGDDAAFTRALFARQHITVVPGSYLARESGGTNPGAGFVRISLVASVENCVQAAHRIREFILSDTKS
ncbi:MAG: succinyldiaminopimelate transaminase [Pseudomonadota bacterium]|jgi:N-succinyldiaminopimelate aminotransferase|nr:MAG: succinyldiaminopimelate transaminase [Pseudomonadota bacterium]